MITHITSSFKKTRMQFFEKAKSHTLYAVTICTLTGSVEAMSVSADFYKLFKSIFKLSELGFWWSQARTAIKRGTQFS